MDAWHFRSREGAAIGRTPPAAAFRRGTIRVEAISRAGRSSTSRRLTAIISCRHQETRLA
eukprot:6139396-Prorocentrum_lima.AAC.1